MRRANKIMPAIKLCSISEYHNTVFFQQNKIYLFPAALRQSFVLGGVQRPAWCRPALCRPARALGPPVPPPSGLRGVVLRCRPGAAGAGAAGTGSPGCACAVRRRLLRHATKCQVSYRHHSTHPLHVQHVSLVHQQQGMQRLAMIPIVRVS